ncbi:MAG: hypothetical protein IJ814_08000 [Paludibacteraceae bacterium]|nr:hypothetical protein [Paludibacteraceae bacterium]
MEDIVLRMPSADVAMVMQFASRMGWIVEKPSTVIDHFIKACNANPSNALSEEEIQAEVNAVRYGK